MAVRGSKFILLFCVILVSMSTIKAIDISSILDNHPEFSLFRDLLIHTKVEKEINNRLTLTVLVLDNSVMGSIMSKPSDEAGKMLATHVILDYCDESRLMGDQFRDKSTLLTTLFQTSGLAVNQQGLLNVTVSDNGGVVFGSAVPGAPHASKMVRTVVANPYEISVIQISQPIMTPGLSQISPFTSPSPSTSTSASSPVPALTANEHGASPTINDNAIDIAKLLDSYEEFTSFMDLLRHTNLEKDIDARDTLTVLVVDNSMMDAINRMPLDQSRRILATHVILDYYDEKKFAEMRGKTTMLTTFFQATGMAIDQQGFLEVTISDDGDVVFGSAVQGAPHVSKMVRSVVTYPYEISVIQICQPIITPGLVSLPPSLSPSSNPSPSASPSSSPSATSPVPASAPNGHITSPTPAPIPTPQNKGSPVPVPAPIPTPENEGSPVPVPTSQNEGSPVPAAAPVPTSQNNGSPVPVPAPIPTPQNQGIPVSVPVPAPAFHEGPSVTPIPAPHAGAVPTPAPHVALTPAPSPHHHKGVSEGPESEDEDYEDAGAPEGSPQRAPAPAPAPEAADKEAADRLAPAKLIKSGAAHDGVGSGAVVAALVALATLTLA